MTDASDDFDVTVDDDDDDDYQAPARAEWERTTAALKKANAEAAKYRREKRELAKQIQSSDPANPEDKKAAELMRTKITEEAREAEASVWHGRVVRHAARAALKTAGLVGDPTQLSRLVNENEVELDSDGEVADGLDEQIEKFKDDYPALFEEREPQRISTRRTRIDGGDRTTRVRERPLSSAEKIQQMALGRKPR